MLSRRRITLCVIALAFCALLAWFVHARAIAAADPGARIARCLEQQNSVVLNECLRSTVRAILSGTSTAALMDYIVSSSSPAIVEAHCHVVAHAVGQETFVRQPDTEQSLAQCTQACASGCVHGAIAAQIAHELGGTYLEDDIVHADKDELLARGRQYCARGTALCHSMGHIARLASQNLSEALETCDRVATTSLSSQACQRGVFMEDEGTLAFSVKTSRAVPPNYGYPCNAVSERYADSCYLYLLDYQIRLFDAERLPMAQRQAAGLNVCESLSGHTRSACFYGLGFRSDNGIAPSGALTHQGKSYCSDFPSSDSLECIGGLAAGYAYRSRYTDVIGLCDSEPDASQREACYAAALRATVDTSAMKAACADSGSHTCRDELSRFFSKKAPGAGDTIE